MNINLINIQSKPIVVSSNTTAENDKVYHVVANATFTDPSPVEGRGFTVFVRNGTATIGGSNFTHSGTIIKRTFHSGSWGTVLYSTSQFFNSPDENVSNKSTNVNADQASNAKYPSVKALFDWATALFFPKPTGTTSQYLRGDGSLETFPSIPSIAGLVPETRTINGLDLSANRVLTASDVGAPSGSGTSTGTNTGDETQASILAKLGLILDSHIGGSVTNNLAFARLRDIAIPANTLDDGDVIQVSILTLQNITALSKTCRLHLTQDLSTNLDATNVVAAAPGSTNATIQHVIIREFIYWQGNLQLLQPSTSFVVNDPTTVGTADTTELYPFNPTVINYLSISAGSVSATIFTKELKRSIIKIIKK